jgi:hypothetical protein
MRVHQWTVLESLLVRWLSFRLIINSRQRDINAHETYLSQRSRVLLQKLIVPQLVDKRRASLEPEVPLPYSEHLANCSYPEPRQSNPRLTNIHFNIIFPSVTMSLKCFPSFRFSPPKPGTHNTSYMHRPSHPSWFDQPNNIYWTVEITMLLNKQSSPVPSHLPYICTQNTAGTSCLE